MKRAISSGARSTLCDLLLLALLLSLSGCASEVTSGISIPDSVATTAEINKEPELVAAAAETQLSDPDTNYEDAESVIPAPANDAGEEQPALSSVEISFDFERMSTHASNQLAIWVEDSDGQLVKTILVTSFTAARRGYRNRDMALSHWVGAANPESMSDDQIDTISSATPSAGHLTYSWNLTDQNDNRVSDGIYTVYVEGTLFWESNVLFSTSLDTRETGPGELAVEILRSDPDNSENENMLKNVRISVLPVPIYGSISDDSN